MRACPCASVRPRRKCNVLSESLIRFIPGDGVKERERGRERKRERERERDGFQSRPTVSRRETPSGPLFLTWVQPRFVNTSRHSLRVLFIGSGKLFLNAARKFEMPTRRVGAPRNNDTRECVRERERERERERKRETG